MNEYVGALLRLHEQLRLAGIPDPCARTTLRAYAAALNHRTEAMWRTFYLAVFEQLDALSARALPFVGEGAMPLIALLDDDLGVRLIPAEHRERIARRLVEYDLREASLSS
jgi:hypothetical protein